MEDDHRLESAAHSASRRGCCIHGILELNPCRMERQVPQLIQRGVRARAEAVDTLGFTG